MDDLKRRIVEMIVKRCRLTDVDVENCDYDAPLFIKDDETVEGSFELDSVDALELVAGVKECFNVVVEAENMSVFYSVNTLADYIKMYMETEE